MFVLNYLLDKNKYFGDINVKINIKLFFFGNPEVNFFQQMSKYKQYNTFKKQRNSKSGKKNPAKLQTIVSQTLPPI